MKRFIKWALVAVFLDFVIYALTLVDYHDKETYTQLFPAWIQALGSIGAIAYASRYAMKQMQHEKALERQKAAEADLTKLKSIKWLMVCAYNETGYTRNVISRGSEEDYAIASSDELKDLGELFDRINPFDIPGGDLTLQVITIGSGLKGLAKVWDRCIEESSLPSRSKPKPDTFKELDNGSMALYQICGEAMELVASDIKKLEQVIGKH
ncbi:hypothetical protein [Buttiauxella noackiae]|uniref:hypothetical protein n=1 Tax=Buttiauxella noackiae TaxID=82992 RepID=UPI00055053EB|nr:hypothetical protein [Buttiauxella noackiae]